jgi:hypothetical protein
MGFRVQIASIRDIRDARACPGVGENHHAPQLARQGVDAPAPRPARVSVEGAGRSTPRSVTDD